MLFFNKTFFRYLIILLVALSASGYAVSALALESREFGVIEADGLNMRAGPDMSHPAIRVLAKGTRVRIINDEKKWLKVVYEGDIGYISSDTNYLKRYVIHTVGNADDGELETARAKAREIARKIRAGKEEVSGIEKKEKNVLDELETLDRELSNSRGMLREIRSALSGVDERTAQIQRQIKTTHVAIDEKKAYAENRLVALYKINRLGSMNLLASAGSLQDMFRRKAAIGTVVGHDERIISRLVREKGQLTKLLARLKEEKDSKIALEHRYGQTLSQLTGKKAAREHLLAKIKTEKSSRLETIEYLQTAARQMDKTMASLNREGYDARKAFSEYQGLLKPPVKGKVLSKFGKYIEPRSGVANFRNGIEIQSERGAPVRVVFDGKAIFADWLKGYGRVIIVAHGNNYYTVYAHVDDIFCAKGETVEAGEVIATVGDTGSIVGPALYFEVRHHGNPVNPLEWMDNG